MLSHSPLPHPGSASSHAAGKARPVAPAAFWPTSHVLGQDAAPDHVPTLRAILLALAGAAITAFLMGLALGTRIPVVLA